MSVINPKNKKTTRVGDANTSNNWSKPFIPGKILPNNANKPKK